MAFSNGMRSPPNESSFPTTYTTPIRPIGSQLSSTPSTAERAQLHRRFTTNALPTIPTLSSLGPLSPIGQQRRQAAEPPSASDLAAATLQKIQLLQKRKEEYEALREQRHRFQSALDNFDALNKEELQRLEFDIRKLSMGGHQSEPATPPEYREGMITNGSRVNRLSIASLTSAPGISSIASPRTTRSGSQGVHTPFAHSTGNLLPSFSVPQSRRGSDEEEDSFSGLDFSSASRRPNGVNRNSMPAMSSNFEFSGMESGVNSVLGINNLKSLLADDEDDNVPGQTLSALTDGIKHLHMETNGDGFPLLRRRDTDVDQAPDDRQTNGLSAVHRHRAGQQSLPWNTLRHSQHEDVDENIFASPGRKPNINNRRSMEVYSSGFGTQSKRSSMQSMINGYPGGVPKLQQSFSTNDIPTVKNANMHEQNTSSAANMTHAEQHLHNHNASMGRIPIAASNRQSRDFTSFDTRADESPHVPVSSALQGNAPAFQNPSGALNSPTNLGSLANTMPSTFGHGHNYYNNYNPPAMTVGMNAVSFGGLQAGWTNGGYGQHYQNYNHYSGVYPRPAFQAPDSQRTVMKNRKGEEENTRFTQHNLETLTGQIYDLCKDQHGCRYLQRKIEEGNDAHIEMIFNETKDHIVELMTDPFGNYLCQKLLEYCNDDQRTTLINNAAPHMVKIALNQHGTRALQKMIEFISTPEQIETIKHALSADIVGLIQDLNGNHVIQKCLNHLKPEDADFIFQEVARNCLSVGTHRHGCCVLQRCIDHAVNGQKAMLIQSVIANAFALVQDPFGNYVVQYILDLAVPEFTRPLCLSFEGRMVELSRQKFSSNVMEKMIRCSPMDIRHNLCMEYMTSSHDVERHIRDMYTNYVVQTILDYGSPETAEQMWSLIRPIIDRVRATPAGRRIHNKLQAHDAESEGKQPINMNNGSGGFYTAQTLPWMPHGAQHPHGNGTQPSFF
ncbi:hypothetical protein, variant [Verruconis gallopava]|uniref:PUM-HD domain-containing protein n=1 Tax=Verruconis gallopava TaxID=253628 RepID=A0A0D1YGI3_9PEZI|nr:hypothetical protein, variant [Verruconis gallopava]KIV99906.1 hypothetical protein, variant [Verruconis gallopava]